MFNILKMIHEALINKANAGSYNKKKNTQQ